MLMSTRDADMEQFVRMEPGDVHVYHVGMLAMARGAKTSAAKAASEKAAAAYKAYQLGIVYLVQKRLGPYKFEYRAVRR